jgi:hypothetical protein
MRCMNIIPAAHFHTVVNALHERSCAMTAKALDADAEARRLAEYADAIDPDGTRKRDAESAARAYRSIAAEARSAFECIMRNAPVVNGAHSCGIYRVPAE